MSDKNNIPPLDTEERGQFSGQLGVVLAALGSAMGLSNLWLFPARMLEFGGLTFLIPFAIFLFGMTAFGLMGEFALGRKAQRGPVGAFDFMFKSRGLKHGRKVGWLPVIGLMGVLTFYCVIIGWVLRYIAYAAMNVFPSIDSAQAAANLFEAHAGTAANIPWTMAGAGLTALIVSLGVQKGIEKSNTFMMSAFYAVTAVILVRVLTLPDATIGLKHLLTIDVSILLKPRVYIYALGMAFFALSLGGAGMVVYGSYMSKNSDIPDATRKTAALSLIASLMATFCIIPAAFSIGHTAESLGSGGSLLFVALPGVFNSMPGGYFFGLAFFICVGFAALSSSVNMIEVPIEALMDQFKISRGKAAAIMFTVPALICVPLNLDMNLFGAFSNWFSVIIFPMGAILCAVVLYWVYGSDKNLEDLNVGAKRPVGKWFIPYMKYVFTLVSIVVVIAGIVLGDF